MIVITIIQDAQNNMKKNFGDIPLASAMIAWNELNNCLEEYGEKPGDIAVIPWPDRSRWCDRLKLQNTMGACSGWHPDGFQIKKPSKKEMLLQLYIEAWHIICRDMLNPKDVHEALMVIPEYRDTLSGESFFAPFRMKGYKK